MITYNLYVRSLSIVNNSDQLNATLFILGKPHIYYIVQSWRKTSQSHDKLQMVKALRNKLSRLIVSVGTRG